MLRVVVLTVAYAECHYTEWHDAESRGAIFFNRNIRPTCIHIITTLVSTFVTIIIIIPLLNSIKLFEMKFKILHLHILIYPSKTGSLSDCVDQGSVFLLFSKRSD
jgi:hypothetical protein